MISFGFLNPLLLWGLGAASLPIIIHLLNRRRFKRVRWAAIEYLLAALKENKRRIQMEQWLLLLVRTLLVALFALLLSRPLTEGAELFGLLRSRVHHVFLVDDSGSMGQRAGNLIFLQIAGRQVEQAVAALKERRQDDLVTLIRASRPDLPDFLGQRPSQRLQGEIRDLFERIRPFPDGTDLGQLFAAGLQRAREVEGAARERVYVVGDFRKVDWISDDGKPVPEVLNGLRGFGEERSDFRLVHTLSTEHGDRDNQNLAVVAVRRRESQAVVDVPVTFDVEVQNLGEQPGAESQVTLEVSGGARITRPLRSLAAGEKELLSFAHVFREPGGAYVSALLPPDRLPLDDRRSLALEIQPKTRALLVDGNPGDVPEDAETYYLSAAFDPGSDGAAEVVSGIGVETIGDHRLREHDLSKVDLLVLANIGNFDAELVAQLEAYVQGGGGLILFLGDQVDPGQYNGLLFRDGQGLLPAALTEVEGDSEDPLPLVLADPEHPISARATDQLKTLLGLVQVARYYRVAADQTTVESSAQAGAKVVVRIESEFGAPAVVTKTFGQGKVVMFTLSADRDWSSWPENFSFLPFLQQCHEFAVRTAALAPFNVTPRTPFVRRLDPAQYHAEASVRRVTGEETGDERQLTAVPDPQAGSDLVLQISDHDDIGVHRVDLKSRSGPLEPVFFGVHGSPREGLVAMTSERELRRSYPQEIMDRAVYLDQPIGSGQGILGTEGELWRWLAASALLFLFVETMLAWRFGHR